MSGKLYKYENYPNNTITQLREISVEEFDAWDEQHAFSEEYLEKKKSILNAYQQEEARQKKTGITKAAMVAMAVLMLSGTAAAVGFHYIREFYEAADVKVDSKYWLADYADPEYDLPVTVDARGTGSDVDFQVLQADKGEHTITIALLTTVNDPNFEKENGPGIDNYFLKHYWSFSVLIDGKEATPEEAIEDGRYAADEIPLAENQQLVIREFEIDPSIDLSKVDNIQLKMVENITHITEKDEDGFEGWVTEEEWGVLTIPLQGEYAEKQYEIDKELAVGRHSFHIEKIQVLPLEIRVVYDPPLEMFYPTNDGIFVYTQTDMSTNYLLMSDGGKIPMDKVSSSVGGSTMEPDHSVMMDILELDVPIDPMQIIGIEMEGHRLLFE